MNKQTIVDMLKVNDKAVARALVVLNERQTQSEQASQQTQNRNGEGFRPCHARMGTSMATFYLKFNRLSPKQIAYWRFLDKNGRMRIEIYANQLLQVALAKQAEKNLTQKKETLLGDIGNICEEIIAVEEQLLAAHGTDDEQLMDRLYGRLEQLRDQAEEHNRMYKLVA